ncbi:hypothetical protein MVEN_01513000 [Mycena venus]|uniref:Uncharacterized protein n=1 Tax=Mycena venus TaxID=2733690 RepID=A0A8H6XT13_9AGAR|nr:hypothetical protein MVEN_01513000 [Mycena venus]
MRRVSAGARKLLAQPVRWNSTVELLPKSQQEPADPPTPLAAKPDAPRADAPPATRRFPQLRVDDGTPYAPNLDDIAAKAAQGSLSARLAAARAAGTQKPAQDSALPITTPTVSQENLDGPAETARTFPTPQSPQDRRLEFTLARRAERLAREAAASQSPSFPVGTHTFTPTSFPPSPEESQAGIDAGILRRREAIAARRAERLVRDAKAGMVAARVPQPRTPNRAQTPEIMAALEQGQNPQFGMGRGFTARGGMRGRGRGGLAPQTGRGWDDTGSPTGRGRGGMGMRGSTRGGRGRGGGRRRSNRDGEGPRNEEEFMKEIEDWLEADDVHLASSLAPELPTSNLHRELRPRTPASKPAHPQVLRENVGGDYSRFVPQNPQLFIASARKIGPVTHSSVILAHAKQVVLENRTLAKEVVESVARAS